MQAFFSLIRQVTMMSVRLSALAQGDDWVEETPEQAFRWSGQMIAGQKLTLIGVNGAIRVRGVEGNEVRVTAVKRGDSLKMKEVRVENEQTGDGVTLRAIYPRRVRFGRNNNVEVNFTVEIPARVRLVARVGNGSMNVKSVAADVELCTGNGGISISDSGWVSAESGNGFIHASVRETNWEKPLHFRTANGSIRLELPSGVSARIQAKTVNGTVSADFPLASEKKSRNFLSGVLGDDARRELFCECGNGSIHLSQT